MSLYIGMKRRDIQKRRQKVKTLPWRGEVRASLVRHVELRPVEVRKGKQVGLLLVNVDSVLTDRLLPTPISDAPAAAPAKVRARVVIENLIA